MIASSTARDIAEALLDVGAVSFSSDAPYTWASGLRSPVYCDNRITISYPAVRRRIRDAFCVLLEEKNVNPEAIIGTATAGIPHAAWLAGVLDRPMAYVRSKPKKHGTGSQIEGRIAKGARVVVVEDLVSTGRSSANVVEALRGSGLQVEAVLAIFSYELREAEQTFRALDVPLYTLTNFEEILAAAGGRLTESTVRTIREWRSDPAAWSQRHT